MTGLWKCFFWINHAVIAVNAVLFSCFLIPNNSWYIMPCLIVTTMCMAPMFYSLILWSAIKDKNIGCLYLLRLFFRKTIVSLPLILLILAWAWWGGGMAIFGGGIVASWLGNIIFWMSKRHDLSAVLPETVTSRQPLHYRLPDVAGVEPTPIFSAMTGSMRGCNNTDAIMSATGTPSDPFMVPTANTAVNVHLHDTFNPASGLPMVNSGFDSQGNVYGTSSSGSYY